MQVDSAGTGSDGDEVYLYLYAYAGRAIMFHRTLLVDFIQRVTEFSARGARGK